MNTFRLSGQTALITGGASGLGKGMAKCMLQQGAEVVLTGRREELLRQVCKELGPGAHFCPADITQTDQLLALRKAVEDLGLKIDILVSNAGLHLKKPYAEVRKEAFLELLDTHVLACHELVRLFAPAMCQRGHGCIVLVTSMTAFMGMPEVIAYTAAKSAIKGMVCAYSSELAPSGVRVNAIAPGWIDSPMLHQALDGDHPRRARILQRTHLGRFGEPEDIGHAATFLASPAAKFITGTTLVVDGGASAGF
jgi:NAD(P)-dependent dehydrogenase (short-subunit alcohol dehydrogenase family)